MLSHRCKNTFCKTGWVSISFNVMVIKANKHCWWITECSVTLLGQTREENLPEPRSQSLKQLLNPFKEWGWLWKALLKPLRHTSQMHIFRKWLAKSYHREHRRPNKWCILIFTCMAWELYWEIYELYCQLVQWLWESNLFQRPQFPYW